MLFFSIISKNCKQVPIRMNHIPYPDQQITWYLLRNKASIGLETAACSDQTRFKTLQKSHTNLGCWFLDWRIISIATTHLEPFTETKTRKTACKNKGWTPTISINLSIYWAPLALKSDSNFRFCNANPGFFLDGFFSSASLDSLCLEIRFYTFHS